MSDNHRPLDPGQQALQFVSLDQHAQELRDSQPYQKTGKSSRCLVRSHDFSMVLMALQPDAELKEHHAPASASAMVLEGEVLFTGYAPEGEQERRLGPHESAVFSSELRHGVRAVQPSLLLLVIGGRGATS
jgi:quercetin dioxygenase-like cupin family protein